MYTEPDTTNLIDRLATMHPERQPGAQSRIHGDTRDTVSYVVYHLYVETLRKTLIRALQQGYAGVDIIHLKIEGLSPHSKLDIWEAQKWTEEPPEFRPEHSRRYDFRYYDRERLVAVLESTTSLGEGSRDSSTAD